MINVWVFENDARYMDLANDAMDSVCSVYKIDFNVQAFREIAWPPIDFDDAVERSWPDIVVLDMLDSGDKAEGQSVYKAIRTEDLRRQREDADRLPTFVVLWTAYPANDDIGEFMKLKYDDLRLIICDIKSQRALVENIGICIERLQEQNTPRQIIEF